MVAREARVKLSHRNVLRSLALCMRVVGDKADKLGKVICNPTYDRLAEASLCDRRTAIRAVAAARELGILAPRNSDGRVSNDFEMLMPCIGSNGDKKAVFNGAKTAEHSSSNGDKIEPLSVTAQGSNGDSTCHCLKAKRKEVVRKQEQEEGAEGTASFLLTRESNAPNGLTASAQNDADIILVAELADDAPIAPALAAEIAAAAANPTILHKINRDPAIAGRMFQHMLETASDDAALNPALQSDYHEAKMNPTVLHQPIPVSKYDDHDYLDHHDKHRLQAPRFKNPGRGVVIDNDSGVIIGTFNDLPQKSQPPPKARARTYAEAIFGVA
jgi:hypothetical protein